MSAPPFPSLNPPAWPASLTRVGSWTVGTGLVLAAIAGPLHRFGVVGFRPALLTLAAALVLLMVGALLAIVGLLAAGRSRSGIPRGLAAAGIVAALVVSGYLLSWVARGRAAPPIHEVSTDLADPPRFVAVAEIRAGMPGVNPAAYVPRLDGPDGRIDVPALQRRHYPDLAPLELPVPPREALDLARRAAEESGWEIVAVAPGEGRLEATDTTVFFGFEDDVVVRVRPGPPGGSRIDVRSKSRVGLSDAGTNAARVREFMDRIRAR